MEHPFFKDMDWEALEQRQIQPPWRPALSSETDTTYFNHKYTYAEIDVSSSSVCYCLFFLKVVGFNN